MNIDILLNAITPEIYENLKYAVETGRWRNGQLLTPEQRNHCLQVVIAYDLRFKAESERVGSTGAVPSCGDRGDEGEGGEEKADSASPAEWQKLQIRNQG